MLSLLNIPDVLWPLPLRPETDTVLGQDDCAVHRPAGRASGHDPLSARAHGRNSRAPTSTRRAATDHPETTAPSSDRSAGLDAALERLAELAAGGADRDTG